MAGGKSQDLPVNSIVRTACPHFRMMRSWGVSELIPTAAAYSLFVLIDMVMAVTESYGPVCCLLRVLLQKTTALCSVRILKLLLIFIPRAHMDLQQVQVWREKAVPKPVLLLRWLQGAWWLLHQLQPCVSRSAFHTLSRLSLLPHAFIGLSWVLHVLSFHIRSHVYWPTSLAEKIL